MERVQQKREAGSVSKHFPAVSEIVIQMKYSQKGIKPMLRTVNFSPASCAFFRVACLSKSCVDGGFDLTQVITTMVTHRKAEAKGALRCEGEDRSESDSDIVYKVAINYMS